MKNILFALLLSTAVLEAALPYQISWSSIGGGGGQSSGGAYTLAGTIGQPDAGSSGGGPYTLHGGFWSAFVVTQTEGAPSLRIFRSGPNVILAWPNPSTGFQLQESPSLSSPNWTDVAATPAIVGTEKQVNHALMFGTRFYRLRKP